MFDQPRTWQNGPRYLYHGTTQRHAASIMRAIDPDQFRPFKDFGRGFYLTSSVRQAARWARQQSRLTAMVELPAVVTFDVDLDALARLDILAFIRGSDDAEEFWSFVWHCRANDTSHGRAANGGWYDVVMGPVSAFWEQRACYQGADQISFHTTRALALLSHGRLEVVP